LAGYSTRHSLGIANGVLVNPSSFALYHINTALPYIKWDCSRDRGTRQAACHF